jgi:antitoxin ParD1/3/4
MHFCKCIVYSRAEQTAKADFIRGTIPASGEYKSYLLKLSSIDSFPRNPDTAKFSMPSSYVIGEHFELFIKEQIQQGRYATASEVIRDGLRSLEERETFRALKLEALRAEIQRGSSSGPGIPARQAIDALRAQVKRAIEEGVDGSNQV